MTILKSGNSRSGYPYAKNTGNDIFKAYEQDISVIKFEGVKVRIINIHGEPWFVAKDICDALELTNSRMALQALDEDEKNTVTLTYGNRGNPNHGVVAESGFYKLISRSRKATTNGTFAHRFTNWVFGEVIPSIRKTGAYGVPWGDLQDFTSRNKQSITKGSKAGTELAQRRYEKECLAREESQLWRKYQPDLLAEVS